MTAPMSMSMSVSCTPRTLGWTPARHFGPLLVSGLLDVARSRDEGSCSGRHILVDQPGAVPCACGGCLRYHSRHRSRSDGPETDQHAGGARGTGTHRPAGPCRQAARGCSTSPYAALLGVAPSWAAHADGVFGRHRLVLHLSSPGTFRRLAPISSRVRTWNHTAPPSGCKHETQDVWPNLPPGECECNGNATVVLPVSNERNCLFSCSCSRLLQRGGAAISASAADLNLGNLANLASIRFHLSVKKP